MKLCCGFILCPPLWALMPHPGIGYLAETLKQEGITTRIFDLNAEIHSAIGDSFKKDWTINKNYINEDFFYYCDNHFPSIFDHLFSQLTEVSHLGFTIYKSNRHFTLQLIKEVRLRFPRIKILLGGPETFSMAQDMTLPTELVDHIVLGEGEEAVKLILAGSGQKLFYPPEKGNTHPFPRYENFPLHLYKNRRPIVASRGCTNRCTFCSERLLFKGYRFRQAEDIFEEISFHFREKGIRHFTFYDSLFNGSLKNMERLMDLIIESSMKLCWEAQISIRTDMGLELLNKMKRSGCINLFIGMESGSGAILKRMKKPFTPEEAAAFLKSLHQTGLQYEVSLIANFPGEGEKEFGETVSFLRQHKGIIKKIAQISRFRNYPGTDVDIPAGYKEEDDRINRLTELLREEGIPFTPSYIDNLI